MCISPSLILIFRSLLCIMFIKIGGSLYKGFNRTIATSTGGALALGIHFFADKSGKTFEPLVLGASLFLLGKEFFIL